MICLACAAGMGNCPPAEDHVRTLLAVRVTDGKRIIGETLEAFGEGCHLC